jgi:hypothetical protein
LRHCAQRCTTEQSRFPQKSRVGGAAVPRLVSTKSIQFLSCPCGILLIASHRILTEWPPAFKPSHNLANCRLIRELASCPLFTQPRELLFHESIVSFELSLGGHNDVRAFALHYGNLKDEVVHVLVAARVVVVHGAQRAVIVDVVDVAYECIALPRGGRRVPMLASKRRLRDSGPEKMRPCRDTKTGGSYRLPAQGRVKQGSPSPPVADRCARSIGRRLRVPAPSRPRDRGSAESIRAGEATHRP